VIDYWSRWLAFKNNINHNTKMGDDSGGGNQMMVIIIIIVAVITIGLIVWCIYRRCCCRSSSSSHTTGGTRGGGSKGKGYERVVTIELRSATSTTTNEALDTDWFERTWQALDHEAAAEPAVLQLLLRQHYNPTNSNDNHDSNDNNAKSNDDNMVPVDAAAIENCLQSHNFTVLASGLRDGNVNMFFFGQDMASYTFALAQLVLRHGHNGSDHDGSHANSSDIIVDVTMKCEDVQLLRAFVAQLHISLQPLILPSSSLELPSITNHPNDTTLDVNH
jgi:hypothetical protein